MLRYSKGQAWSPHAPGGIGPCGSNRSPNRNYPRELLDNTNRVSVSVSVSMSVSVFVVCCLSLSLPTNRFGRFWEPCWGSFWHHVASLSIYQKPLNIIDFLNVFEGLGGLSWWPWGTCWLQVGGLGATLLIILVSSWRSWGHLGSKLGGLAGILAPTWGVLGASWLQLRGSWGHLGSNLGGLRAILAPTWGVLAATWRCWGQSWLQVGAQFFDIEFLLILVQLFIIFVDSSSLETLKFEESSWF